MYQMFPTILISFMFLCFITFNLLEHLDYCYHLFNAYKQSYHLCSPFVMLQRTCKLFHPEDHPVHPILNSLVGLAISGAPIADTGVEMPGFTNASLTVRDQIPAATFQHLVESCYLRVWMKCRISRCLGSNVY